MKARVEYSKQEDSVLVELYLQGDEMAFNELFNRYYQRLWRVVFYYTGDTENCQDVLNDVFMRVVKHLETYDTSKAFSSWVYKIAVNCSKNFLGKKQKYASVIEQELVRVKEEKDSYDSPEEMYITESEIQALSEAINSLKEKFRDVFVLRFDQHMSYREIGDVLDCSERTAKWRMKRAIENITRYLSDRGMTGEQ